MEMDRIQVKTTVKHNLHRFVALLALFFLVSCFPGDDSQQTGSVEQHLQIQQTTAVSYARMFQQYSALSQQYLMKDVWEDGVAQIPADGIISSDTFAAQYNVDRASEFLESAYCDMGSEQYHISWFKGDETTSNGAVIGVERRDLKGLGKAGYGSILKVMAREMSPRSYGSYDSGKIKLGDGSVQPLTCAAIAYIPEGAPVIVSSVKNNTTQEEREYYVYNSAPCPSSDQTGVIRTRIKMVQTYNENGYPVGFPSEAPGAVEETIVNACQTDPNTPSIQVEADTVDVIDYASVGLSGTIEANCFEATKLDATGEPVVDAKGNPIVFSNCSGTNYDYTNLPPGQELTNCTFLRTETHSAPCTGSGWSGSANYERDVYLCDVYSNGAPTGEKYEEAREWRTDNIYCSRNEETYFFCPFSNGTLRYTRLNVINSFESGGFGPGNPTNPNWSYTSGRCDLNVRNCNPRYLGNDRVADVSIAGALDRRPATSPHNLPGADVLPISTLCGSGAQCIEIRDGLSCPVANMSGSRTEERTYTCSGVGVGSWSHPAAPAPWLEVANTCNCKVWAQTDYDVKCSAFGYTPACNASSGDNCPTVGNNCYNADPTSLPGSTCPINGQSPYEVQTLQCRSFTDAASCSCVEQEQTRTTGQPGAPSCPAGQTGSITERRVKSCPSGVWSAWERVSNTCSCAPPYNRNISGGSCPAGQTGSITLHQTKNPATCAWQTTSTTNTCVSCGTTEYEWRNVNSVTQCRLPNSSGGPFCSTAPGYPYALCGFNENSPTSCSAGQVGQRCNTAAHFDDIANNCRDCNTNIFIVGAYSYSVFECQSSTGATCCTPYYQNVGAPYDSCSPGQSGRTCQDRVYYGCDGSNNQTGPTAAAPVCNGTCQPTASCTNGDIRNEVFCPAPNSGIRDSYQECQGGNWVTVDDQTCPAAQCTPGQTQTRDPSCGAGQEVSSQETRTCQANSTWGPWTGGSCCTVGYELVTNAVGIFCYLGNPYVTNGCGGFSCNASTEGQTCFSSAEPEDADFCINNPNPNAYLTERQRCTRVCN